MLQLFANNVQLDIKGIKFTLVKKSSLDIENTFEGSFIFNFTIPGTDKNNSIFSYPYRLTKHELSNLSIDGRVVFNGIGFIEGTYKVIKATKRAIQLRLNADAGAYNSLIKGVKVPDIFTETVSLGETTQDVIDHANAQVEKDYPDTDYNFPVIYNPYFYGPLEAENDDDVILNPDYKKYMNLWDPENDTFLDNSSLNQNTLVPQFFVFYVLKKCFTYFGYSITGKLFSDTELIQLMMYNNFALDKMGEIIETDLARASNYFIDQVIADGSSHLWTVCELNNDSTSPNQDPNDNFDLTTETYEIKSAGTHAVTLIMKYTETYEAHYGIYVKVYKDGVALSNALTLPNPDQTYTFESTYEFDSGDIGSKLDVRASRQKPGWGFTIETYDIQVQILSGVGQVGENIFAKKIIYSNHMPDMLISDFVSAFFISFGIIPFFNHRMKTVELVLIRDILRSFKQIKFIENPIRNSIEVKPNDYSGIKFFFNWGSNDEYLQDNFKELIYDIIAEINAKGQYPSTEEINVLVYIKNINQYYIRAFNHQGYLVWQYFTDNGHEQVYDDGTKVINIDASPLLMTTEVNPITGSGYWLVPKTYAKGTSEAFNTGKYPFDLRFFFWRGIQNFYVDLTYPMGSVTVYAYNGNKMGFNYEYKLNGQYGLINTWYSEYIEWLQRRQPITFKIQLSLKEIAQLELSRKHRCLEWLYLMKKVEIPIGNRKVDPARITGYTF